MAEINVGQISEALNDKADRDLNNAIPPVLLSRQLVDDVLIETWSDGYCVQSGVATTTGAGASEFVSSITFKRAYKDTTYHVELTVRTPIETTSATAINAKPIIIYPLNRTATGMTVVMDSNTGGQSATTPDFYYKVSGYTA